MASLNNDEKKLITDSKWIEGTQEAEWKDQNGVTWKFEEISDRNKDAVFR